MKGVHVRNIKLLSTLGQAVDVGLTRIHPGVNLTQRDLLTPQFLRDYGTKIVIANMDNVIEHMGGEVDIADAVQKTGWMYVVPVSHVLTEAPSPPAPEAKEDAPVGSATDTAPVTEDLRVDGSQDAQDVALTDDLSEDTGDSHEQDAEDTGRAEDGDVRRGKKKRKR